MSEAIHLTCGDVDLSEAALTIRLTKLYKLRHIALCPQLQGVLSEYDLNRCAKGHCRDATAPFFTYKNGGPMMRCVIEDGFLRLRRHAGVSRQNARYQPRLHDLRHTFAVHRVIAWYRSGAEVQSLLPALATHLWIATYSEKSPGDPVMRLFRATGATREALFLIAAFCRLENSLSCSEHMGWLVGAVGIEPTTFGLKGRCSTTELRP